MDAPSAHSSPAFIRQGSSSKLLHTGATTGSPTKGYHRLNDNEPPTIQLVRKSSRSSSSTNLKSGQIVEGSAAAQRNHLLLEARADHNHNKKEDEVEQQKAMELLHERLEGLESHLDTAAKSMQRS